MNLLSSRVLIHFIQVRMGILLFINTTSWNHGFFGWLLLNTHMEFSTRSRPLGFCFVRCDYRFVENFLNFKIEILIKTLNESIKDVLQFNWCEASKGKIKNMLKHENVFWWRINWTCLSVLCKFNVCQLGTSCTRILWLAHLSTVLKFKFILQVCKQLLFSVVFFFHEMTPIVSIAFQNFHGTNSTFGVYFWTFFLSHFLICFGSRLAPHFWPLGSIEKRVLLTNQTK